MVERIRTDLKRSRIVDLDPDLRKRIRVAAARRDVAPRRWCFDALLEKLEDEEDASEGSAALDDYDKHGGVSWGDYKQNRKES